MRIATRSSTATLRLRMPLAAVIVAVTGVSLAAVGCGHKEEPNSSAAVETTSGGVAGAANTVGTAADAATHNSSSSGPASGYSSTPAGDTGGSKAPGGG